MPRSGRRTVAVFVTCTVTDIISVTGAFSVSTLGITTVTVSVSVTCTVTVTFFFRTLLFSSFWTSRGHRCRPFPPPVLAFNFYRA